MESVLVGLLNIRLGVQKSIITLDKLFTDSIYYTKNLLVESPVIYLKRPIYKRTNLGMTKKYIESKVLYDMTNHLYRNRDFLKKYYNDFDLGLLESDSKPSREEFIPEVRSIEKKLLSTYAQKSSRTTNYRNEKKVDGYCIRTGQQIPFNADRPYTLDAYRSWAKFENWNYQETYCHRTGRESNGKTSMANPALY